ncbi:MAG: MBL fold metallo-hydrolase [Polyangiaceae bacterium]|nr:MBL fold metallo-hydrolase [Polyangiaceae bacterium]
MASPRLVTIDCDYLGPGVAAAYLRIQGDEAAFVETNTNHAVPKLLAALEQEGLSPKQVRYIIVTHVHLDHAGGTSLLAKACPDATVLAHPRAARHLIDPSKLVASARAVYGAERFDALYGTIESIDAARVRSLDDGAVVPFGETNFHFIHTRGHANHHFIVHDPARSSVFTGDTFGLSYPRLQRGRPFVFPSTSPTDFDAAAAHASVDVVRNLGTERAALTHFGEVGDLDVIAAQLHQWLDISASLMNQSLEGDPAEAEKNIRTGLEAAMQRAVNDAGIVLDAEDRALLELDIGLNAQGLAYAASKLRA